MKLVWVMVMVTAVANQILQVAMDAAVANWVGVRMAAVVPRNWVQVAMVCGCFYTVIVLLRDSNSYKDQGIIGSFHYAIALGSFFGSGFFYKG
jgi:hypothetical protein